MTESDQPIEEQAQQQTGQRQITVHVDEREMDTSYANGFRTNGTAEEVMIDFGLNVARPGGPGEGGNEANANVQFKVNDRVILNYYTAKRLAITLGQIVRKHEEQFGELQMNVADRIKGGQ